MRARQPRPRVKGTTVLKTSSAHSPAAWPAVHCRDAVVAMTGGLARAPRPGKAATGLEGRVVGQGLVATPRWGGKVVTAILSATYNFRLQMGRDQERQT